MQRLHEEHANVLLERHVANIADELIEVEAVVIAARGASTTTTTSAAATAIVAVQDGTSSTPKLDEFGSDANFQKCLESKRQA
jgi:sirohydrochlorin ferrochelatase